MLTERFVSGNLQFGLGNQLFQMAAVFAHAKKHKRTPVISRDGANKHTKEKFGETVFSRFKKGTTKPDAKYNQRTVNTFTSKEVIPDKGSHLLINGVYICESYFKPYGREFVDSLVLPSMADSPDACFIHVRRGDTLKGIFGMLYYVNLMQRYIPRAIDLVRSKKGSSVKFHIFSDDLEWCRRQPLFQTPDFVFIDEKDPVRALTMMSKCVVGGICWNSTFSWWASYINPNPNKIVTMPLQWSNWVPVDVWPSSAHIISNSDFVPYQSVAIGMTILFGVICVVLISLLVFYATKK